MNEKERIASMQEAIDKIAENIEPLLPQDQRQAMATFLFSHSAFRDALDKLEISGDRDDIALQFTCTMMKMFVDTAAQASAMVESMMQLQAHARPFPGSDGTIHLR